MTELLTQVEVEERMYYGGVQRATQMMERAEAAGRAHQNPYAQAIFQEFVLPLAAAVHTQVNTTKAGRRQAHATLLAPLNPEAVAFLAVRTTINLCMEGGREHTLSRMAYAVGRTVHNELVLAQLEQEAPELYYTLSRDLGRRMSKDERHRMTVFKMQAKKAGVEWAEWDLGSRHQVGMYLLGLLMVAGMIDIEPLRPGRPGQARPPRLVTLSDEVLEKVTKVRAFVAIAAPLYGPCVAPPVDWPGVQGGGYHTALVRRRRPFLVNSTATARPLYRQHQMPMVLKAVNAIQKTAWRINRRVLDTVKVVGRHFSTDEIVTLVDLPVPERPADVSQDAAKSDMTPEQVARFTAWKREMAEYYTERKARGVKYGRLHTALKVAEEFREAPSIYFVHMADSRGRLYPLSYGVSPQGSDLQKALLEFSEGKPLDTPQAIRWFHVQGANKWGFDKATLEERHRWVVERQDLIMSFAENPVDNRGWVEADCPLQFLAWCFEYRDWVLDNTGSFVSRLPISMDGSCNGLQNLSALFRDEVGGRATNLTKLDTMEDIYRRVAEAATVRMTAGRQDDPERESLRQRWLAHGVARSAVKRAVMTTPYGVTRRSATEYVVADYLKTGAAPCFQLAEYRKAAEVLMEYAWPAIGDVVVKGTQAMAWLKASARRIIKAMPVDAEPVISWVTPSGFLATQAYFETEIHRINTHLSGSEKIRVLSETDDPDLNRHASGLAPNFVHSMDAAHLHLTAAAAADAGINSLAMIHDDYGTHAADAQKLFELIREQFVKMYNEHDPIADFVAKYPECSDPPEPGSLDINEVLQSDFFFS